MGSKDHEVIASREARVDEVKRVPRAEYRRDFLRPAVAVALKIINNKQAARA